MLTKQEAFNKIWNHFIIDKNPPGYNIEKRICEYSKKCAIGCLIPDHLAISLDKEGYIISGINETFDGYEELFSILDHRDILFYETIQGSHDALAEIPTFTEEMKKFLIKFSEEHHLEIPE